MPQGRSVKESLTPFRQNTFPSSKDKIKKNTSVYPQIVQRIKNNEKDTYTFRKVHKNLLL